MDETECDQEDDRSEFADDQGTAATAWEQLPPEREFFASPYDPPIKTLVQELRDKELFARPSFQRKQVWDRTRKSRFVESILLNIPIPTLFFAEDENSSKVVVDGQQRLLALKDYLDNTYSLHGLNVLKPLNGKRFDALTERQQRIIRNRTLRCLVISARTDSNIRFEVFERLNQGGVPLNAQEVRHCVYRGELNDLLHQLVKTTQWLRLFGRAEVHPRMLDAELVLRFLALRASLPSYSPPLKQLLSNYMENNRHMTSEAQVATARLFESAVTAVATVFGDQPFRRATVSPGGAVDFDKAVNRAVFDVQMQFFAEMNRHWVAANAHAIRERFIRLCTEDTRFADAISKATADKARTNYRLRRWALALQEIGAELPDVGLIPPEESTQID